MVGVIGDEECGDLGDVVGVVLGFVESEAFKELIVLHNLIALKFII